MELKNKLSMTIIAIFLALTQVCYPVNIDDKREEKIEEKEIEKKERKKPDVYLFQQQINNVCFLSPNFNLSQLKRLLKKYPKAFASGDLTEIPEHEWATKRLWFGREYEYTDLWNNAFQSMISDDYPDLKNYIITGIEEGPVLPHMYTKKGKSIFSGLQSVFFFTSIPYFLSDYSVVKNIKFFMGLISGNDLDITPDRDTQVPFYRDYDGYYYGYIKSTDQFEKMYYYPYGYRIIKDNEGNEKKEILEISPEMYDTYGKYAIYENNKVLKEENLSESLPKEKNIYSYTINILDYKTKPKLKKLKPKNSSIPTRFLTYENDDKKYTYITMQKSTTLGIPEIAIDYNAPQVTLDYNKTKYCSYQSGLYKLMLLRLGLDEKNNDIFSDKNHRLYKVVQDLHKVFNKDKKNNFWSDEHFNKKMLIEYHLAELFKNNRDLFKQAATTVDFFMDGWKSYNVFFNLAKKGKVFRDTKGKMPYTEDILKDYLPGPEQILAYHVIQMVRLLWYGALNPEAFYETTLQPGYQTKIIALLTNRPDWTFKNFKNKAYDKTKAKISFIDAWQNIMKELANMKQKNFVSFDDHGWAISLNDELIKLQNNKAEGCKCDLELLKDLGIAGIESWHGSLLPTFYKKREE